MTSLLRRFSSLRLTGTLALRALRSWTPRQVRAAVAVSIAAAAIIGVATVLIPNPLFSREIPPVWWNYPVWLLTSALTGMLVATYVRPSSSSSSGEPGLDDTDARSDTASGASPDDREMRRTSRMGAAGSVLAWFAVGCPVCNKLAVLALGYSGAITWFTPLQPFLALGALAVTGTALVWRLRGQIVCPLPAPVMEPAR